MGAARADTWDRAFQTSEKPASVGLPPAPHSKQQAHTQLMFFFQELRQEEKERLTLVVCLDLQFMHCGHSGKENLHIHKKGRSEPLPEA